MSQRPGPPERVTAWSASPEATSTGAWMTQAQNQSDAPRSAKMASPQGTENSPTEIQVAAWLMNATGHDRAGADKRYEERRLDGLVGDRWRGRDAPERVPQNMSTEERDAGDATGERAEGEIARGSRAGDPEQIQDQQDRQPRKGRAKRIEHHLRAHVPHDQSEQREARDAKCDSEP